MSGHRQKLLFLLIKTKKVSVCIKRPPNELSQKKIANLMELTSGFVSDRYQRNTTWFYCKRKGKLMERSSRRQWILLSILLCTLLIGYWFAVPPISCYRLTETDMITAVADVNIYWPFMTAVCLFAAVSSACTQSIQLAISGARGKCRMAYASVNGIWCCCCESVNGHRQCRLERKRGNKTR